MWGESCDGRKPLKLVTMYTLVHAIKSTGVVIKKMIFWPSDSTHDITLTIVLYHMTSLTHTHLITMNALMQLMILVSIGPTLSVTCSKWQSWINLIFITMNTNHVHSCPVPAYFNKVIVFIEVWSLGEVNFKGIWRKEAINKAQQKNVQVCVL